MNTTWIIAARELRAGKRVFAICAALAVLPFLTALLPGARASRADFVAMVGALLSITVGLGLAVAYGASTIARELAERRMSFYFAKPVGAAAIWFGKASAALAISLGCFALIALPSFLVSPRSWRLPSLEQGELLALVALLIVEVFLVSHFLSTVVRSRSAWIALDGVCVFASAAGLYVILRSLALGAVANTDAKVAICVGLAATAIMAIAPVWQLARGGTDLRRSHATLSRTVWMAMAVVLLVAGSYAAWMASVGPADLTAVHDFEQAPRGNGVLVTGSKANRGLIPLQFLVDSETGAHRRITTVWPSWGVKFSNGGERAVWLQQAGWPSWGAKFSNGEERAMWLQAGIRSGGELEIHAARIGDRSIAATGIRAKTHERTVLSDDGTRLAVEGERTVSVFDLDSGRLLASGAGLQPGWHDMFFVTPDVVRIIENANSGPRSPLRIFELDVRTRSMTKTGELSVDERSQSRWSLSVSGDGSRILHLGGNRILDGRTAQPIARVQFAGRPIRAEKGPSLGRNRDLLHDGTLVAVTTGEDGSAQLETFSRDGQPQHTVTFPGVRRLLLAGEIEGGKLILAMGEPNTPRTTIGRGMIVFDLKRGVIERVMKDIRGPLPRLNDPGVVRYAAEQPLVALNAQGKLVTWDARTGVVRRIPGM